MSPYRIPLQPVPRKKIWLTPKMPILNIVSLIVFTSVLLYIAYLTFSGRLIQYPYPTQTSTLRFTPTSKSKSTNLPVKTNTPMFTATPLFIAPTAQPSATIAPTPDIWKDCNASYTSRLKVGDKAYVSNNPHLSNRLRAGPYINKKITGYIDPSEQVEILEGPSCSNQWVWWKVRSLKNGEIGWTSEGDVNNYWLVPMK